MRIKMKICPNTTVVPFAHQLNLTGAIHKWLGKNTEHGQISLYSFSQLTDGRGSKDGLNFRNGTEFFISSYDNDMLRRIVEGIFREPDIAFGLRVVTAVLTEEPDLSERTYFRVASPVLVKDGSEKGLEHLLYDNPRASKILTQTMHSKLAVAGIATDGVSVHFDSKYKGAKVRLIRYRNIQNKASMCPVVIEGSTEAKLFAWNVGVGHSTGIGFGAIE